MKQRDRFLSWAFRSFLVVLLIVGVFGLVYLRSNYLKMEYCLGDLEKKRMQALREKKLLLAEKTSLVAFAKLETPQAGTDGFVLPDRIKVIHVDRQKKSMPYKARWREDN
jgi:hypothetical protein